MAVSAAAQVNTILVALLNDNGIDATENRDENNAIVIDEAPCCAISFGGAELVAQDGLSQGTTVHRGRYFLHCIAKAEAGLTQAQGALDMVSAINTLVQVDYTLGGRVQQAYPVNYGNSENLGNDLGGQVLEIGIDFCTPHDDWNTLQY